jgi:hypothetical protein
MQFITAAAPTPGALLRPSNGPACPSPATGARKAGTHHSLVEWATPEAFDTEERLPHGAGFFLAVPLGLLVWAVIGGCFWLIASGAL